MLNSADNRNLVLESFDGYVQSCTSIISRNIKPHDVLVEFFEQIMGAKHNAFNPNIQSISEWEGEQQKQSFHEYLLSLLGMENLSSDVCLKIVSAYLSACKDRNISLTYTNKDFHPLLMSLAYPNICCEIYKYETLFVPEDATQDAKKAAQDIMAELGLILRGNMTYIETLLALWMEECKADFSQDRRWLATDINSHIKLLDAIKNATLPEIERKGSFVINDPEQIKAIIMHCPIIRYKILNLIIEKQIAGVIDDRILRCYTKSELNTAIENQNNVQVNVINTFLRTTAARQPLRVDILSLKDANYINELARGAYYANDYDDENGGLLHILSHCNKPEYGITEAEVHKFLIAA